MSSNGRHLPGITPRSLVIIILSMLAIAMLAQFGEVVEGFSRNFTSHCIGPPAVFTLVAVSLISGAVFALTRRRLLNRPELLCIFFALLIATPLLADGFWHRIIGVLSTFPRTADFERMDAMSDKLWPHGDNLIDGAFVKTNRNQLESAGNVSWSETEIDGYKRAVAPVLANDSADGVSWIRIRAPLKAGGVQGVTLDEPYLISILARAKDLGPESLYYCRVFYDDSAEFAKEAFAKQTLAKKDLLHTAGFRRVGAYGVIFSPQVNEEIVLEFGLEGVGRVEFWDPKLMCVSAFESLFSGRQSVTEEQSLGMRESELARLVVKPDSMWSLKGLKYLLFGCIPVREWASPLIAWLTFLVLLLLASYAVAAIMRRQWIDAERFPMPLTRIPAALLGEGEPGALALPSIWRNRAMWIGFGASLFWCLMRVWSLYNPNVPDMNIRVPLHPYFNDSQWGQTWNFDFQISVFFLSMAIFMELNVLVSLVIGFFLFRMSLWVHQITPMKTDPLFPYGKHQIMGGYLAYGLVILFFVRKYLWSVVKQAWTGRMENPEGEAMSYRSSLLLFLATFLSVAFWSRWIGISTAGVVIFFGFMILTGFVGAKIRAECGTPFSGYFPYYPMLFLTLVGGLSVFGPKSYAFTTIASYVFAGQVFFLVSGMQVELVEMSRRFHLSPRHALAACLLGVVGGLVIGGWTLLTALYSIGVENIDNQPPFLEKTHYFRQYNREMTRATALQFGENPEEAAGGIDRSYYGFAFGAGMTLILSVLRQFFAGFWFHPVGFLLAPSSMIQAAWGSVLAAWLIRLLVLKLGGAAMVRTKLLPFFTGAFLGGVASYLVFMGYNGFLYFFYPGTERFGLIF